MTRQTWRRAAIALVVATMTGTAGLAQAAPPGTEGEARAHYSRGVELYNDGIYGAALAELERAQSLAPHYGILHSIGLVKVQLADFVGALAAFEEYLAAGADEIQPQRKQEVEAKVTQLKERIGSLEVVAPNDGLEVLVDDAVIGVTPLPRPFRVNPGKHDVVARRPGERGEVKKVSVAGGDKLKVTFDAAASTGKPAPPPDRPPPPPRAETPASSGPLPTWLIGTWIGTGVLAAGAVTTGIVGLSQASDLEKLRTETPSSAATLDDKAGEVQTWGIVTDVLIGSAVVLGAVSLYFTLRPGTRAAATQPLKVGLGALGGTF